MAKSRLVLNQGGFRELRTSKEARDLVRKVAEGIADRAGAGFEVLPEESPRNRAHAVVAPVTIQAARRNARDNTLIRAMPGGGL